MHRIVHRTDDNETRRDVGWRNLVIDPLRSGTTADIETPGTICHVVAHLPEQPQAWRVWRDVRIDDGRFRQRNGRMNTRDTQSEADHGYPNAKWQRKLDYVHSVGGALRTATSYQDVVDVVTSWTQEKHKRSMILDRTHGLVQEARQMSSVATCTPPPPRGPRCSEAPPAAPVMHLHGWRELGEGMQGHVAAVYGSSV
jgi:hypothetical protein